MRRLTVLDIPLLVVLFWGSVCVSAPDMLARLSIPIAISLSVLALTAELWAGWLVGLYAPRASLSTDGVFRRCVAVGLLTAAITWVPMTLLLSTVWQCIVGAGLHAVVTWSWLSLSRLGLTRGLLRVRTGGRERAVLVGSPAECARLLGLLDSQPPELFHLVGCVLTDDGKPLTHHVRGTRVLGSTERIQPILATYRIEKAIVCHERPHDPRFRAAAASCRRMGVPVAVLPTVDDLLSGRLVVRPVEAFDLNELLRRQPVQLEEQQCRELLEGRVVMVTGAGGSIGSELCRQIMRYRPQRLILVDNSEFNLYVIDLEMREHTGPDVVSCVADVRDQQRIEAVVADHLPAVVFHAAAYKHVPMMECNPVEAIRNNVFGTLHLADACRDHRVERFVLVSSDKAVRPTNIMGASKRMAEIYVQHLNGTSSTRFVAVRFGNVLGSSGSVVPLFMDQIRRGGPVTVTHPEVIRYFMTTAEAAQLVIQAGALSHQGEIFLLDMGEPIKIDKLARRLVELMGRRPGEDVEIVYTGLRPGEKLYEELLIEGREKHTTHEKIMVARSAPVGAQVVDRVIRQLDQACGTGSRAQIDRVLELLIPEYLSPGPHSALPIVRAELHIFHAKAS